MSFELMSMEEAAQYMFDVCKDNGFGFDFDPANEKMTVKYRFNEGFTRYSEEQVFHGPKTSSKEIECVSQVAEMIANDEKLFEIRRYLSEFVPF